MFTNLADVIRNIKEESENYNIYQIQVFSVLAEEQTRHVFFDQELSR